MEHNNNIPAGYNPGLHGQIPVLPPSNGQPINNVPMPGVHFGSVPGGSGGGPSGGGADDEVREQDRYLPVANIARIMKRVLPPNEKIAKDAKESVQECVSEFIAFITSEASDRCQAERRKTINGEDILWAIGHLGFDDYNGPLKTYLQKYRQAAKGDKPDNSQANAAASAAANNAHVTATLNSPSKIQAQNAANAASAAHSAAQQARAAAAAAANAANMNVNMNANAKTSSSVPTVGGQSSSKGPDTISTPAASQAQVQRMLDEQK